MHNLSSEKVRSMALSFKNEGMTVVQISEELNIPKPTLYDFFNKRTYKAWWDEIEGKEVVSGNAVIRTEEVEVEIPFNGEMKDHYTEIKDLGCTKYVLTSCQNNTFINEEFFDSLLSYCEHNDAELLVSPFVYNLDGILGTKKDVMLTWDNKVKPYLVRDPIKLSDYLGGLVFCAELDILPTAVSPLSGLHSYTKTSSGIFPHTKMQLESLPTAKSDPCRMLYTTGAVSQRNYIPRKAGQKASFHHVFGALIVEIDHTNKCWYVRQLNADDDGSFQDLEKVYWSNGDISDQGRIEAINWGDIHSEKMNNNVAINLFGRDGILDQLTPKYQFCHDLSDFTPRNHHNRNDPHFLYKTSLSNIRTVEEGLEEANKLLRMMSRPDINTIVVNSNHDNALLRWLKEGCYKKDPDNAMFFLKAQLSCYEAMFYEDKDFMIFEHALRELVNGGNGLDYANVKFLREDQSFKICLNDGDENAIECGNHGHLGSNGARGSVSTYQKLGHRQNIGHSHSAHIKDGVYQAGVSGNLDMGYNIGASSWSHSHIITYENGKRTMITCHNGCKNWRL